MKEDSRISVIQILLCLLEMHNLLRVNYGPVVLLDASSKLSAKILLKESDSRKFCCFSVCITLSS